MSESIQTLKIADVRRDGGTQSRAALDPDTVKEYAEAMSRCEQFPPGEVYFDGTSHWIAEGFHRTQAVEESGGDEFDYVVKPGTRRDAMLHSARANTDHDKPSGLPRSNADKRQAVTNLLADAECVQWSDRAIARWTDTSHTFVSDLRHQLEEAGEIDPVTERVYERDGQQRTMSTGSIASSNEARALAAFPVGSYVRFEGESGIVRTRIGIVRDHVGQWIQIEWWKHDGTETGVSAIDPDAVQLAKDDDYLRIWRLSTRRSNDDLLFIEWKDHYITFDYWSGIRDRYNFKYPADENWQKGLAARTSRAYIDHILAQGGEAQVFTLDDLDERMQAIVGKAGRARGGAILTSPDHLSYDLGALILEFLAKGPSHAVALAQHMEHQHEGVSGAVFDAKLEEMAEQGLLTRTPSERGHVVYELAPTDESVEPEAPGDAPTLDLAPLILDILKDGPKRMTQLLVRIRQMPDRPDGQISDPLSQTLFQLIKAQKITRKGGQGTGKPVEYQLPRVPHDEFKAANGDTGYVPPAPAPDPTRDEILASLEGVTEAALRETWHGEMVRVTPAHHDLIADGLIRKVTKWAEGARCCIGFELDSPDKPRRSVIAVMKTEPDKRWTPPQLVEQTGLTEATVEYELQAAKHYGVVAEQEGTFRFVEKQRSVLAVMETDPTRTWTIPELAERAHITERMVKNQIIAGRSASLFIESDEGYRLRISGLTSRYGDAPIDPPTADVTQDAPDRPVDPVHMTRPLVASDEFGYLDQRPIRVVLNVINELEAIEDALKAVDGQEFALALARNPSYSTVRQVKKADEITQRISAQLGRLDVLCTQYERQALNAAVAEDMRKGADMVREVLQPHVDDVKEAAQS